MEKFGCFIYTLRQNTLTKKWGYTIYEVNYAFTRESDEIYELKGIARLAAIGHITVLEQQKDNGHSFKCP